jgi:NAD-dependent SIR2 family protein deacetylase
MEYHFQDFNSGTPPTCPACLKAEEARHAVLPPKRQRKVGQLRPDILLYGELNPWEDITAGIIENDAKSITPNAVLLVVGTSIKIRGIQHLIKRIGPEVKAKGGHVININQTPSESVLRRFFDLEVLEDCQVFAQLLIQRFQEKKGKDNIKPYEHGAVARADYRPLWDWSY